MPHFLPNIPVTPVSSTIMSVFTPVFSPSTPVQATIIVSTFTPGCLLVTPIFPHNRCLHLPHLPMFPKQYLTWYLYHLAFLVVLQLTDARLARVPTGETWSREPRRRTSISRTWVTTTSASSFRSSTTSSTLRQCSSASWPSLTRSTNSVRRFSTSLVSLSGDVSLSVCVSSRINCFFVSRVHFSWGCGDGGL